MEHVNPTGGAIAPGDLLGVWGARLPLAEASENARAQVKAATIATALDAHFPGERPELLLEPGRVLVAAVVLLLLPSAPGLGERVNGVKLWVHVGPLQFQPSELLKLSLVLFAAQLLAARPSATKSFGGLAKPLLIVVGISCLMLLKQPDMGTAMVICFTIGTLLFVAGTPMRLLGTIGGSAITYEVWEPLPLPGTGRSTLSLEPIVGPRFGVSATLALGG